MGLNKGITEAKFTACRDQGMDLYGRAVKVDSNDMMAENSSWTKEETHGKISNIIAIHQDDAGWLWLHNNDLKEIIFLNAYTNEIKLIEERFGNTFPLTKKRSKPVISIITIMVRRITIDFILLPVNCIQIIGTVLHTVLKSFLS